MILAKSVNAWEVETFCSMKVKGDSKSRVYLKIPEHSSTSLICWEAIEPHIERILELQSENDSYSRVGPAINWLRIKVKEAAQWHISLFCSTYRNKYANIKMIAGPGSVK